MDITANMNTRIIITGLNQQLKRVKHHFRKPKKQLREQKLQHLQNIRVKALEKKKQMK